MSLGWLKNTDGKPSSSFSMMIVAFSIVSLWLLLSIFTKVGHFEIRPFSGTEAMAYLSPCFMLYYGRKGQDMTTGIISPPTDQPTS